MLSINFIRFMSPAELVMATSLRRTLYRSDH